MSRASSLKRKAKLKKRKRQAPTHGSPEHNPATCETCLEQRRLRQMLVDKLDEEGLADNPLKELHTHYILPRVPDVAPLELVFDLIDSMVEVDDDLDMDEDERHELIEELRDEVAETSNTGFTFDLPVGLAHYEVETGFHYEPAGGLSCRYDVRIFRASATGAYSLRLTLWHHYSDPAFEAVIAPRIASFDDSCLRGYLTISASQPIDQGWMDETPSVSVLRGHLASVSRHRLPFSVPCKSPPNLGPLLLDTTTRLHDALQRLDKTRGDVKALQRERKALNAKIDADSRALEAARASIARRDRAARELMQKARQDHAGQTMSEHTSSSAPDADTQELLQSLQEQCDAANLVASQRGEELDAMRKEMFVMQARVQQLQDALQAGGGTPAPEPAGDPESLAELGDWLPCLDGRVVVHPKALAAAAESNYTNPGKVYSALRALAEVYWPMLYERGGPTQKQWLDRCSELGLDSSLVGAAATHPLTADAYTVQIDGRKLVMDMHLRGNSSFDPRFGLRIYFTRNDDARQIVVGHLPSHLPNRESN